MLLDSLQVIGTLVKPYLPKVIPAVLPEINKELAAAIYKENEDLQDGEIESAFMITLDGEDVYLHTVQLDADARVVRSSGKRKVTDYLQSLINKAFNSK